jgi:hypothetical protein
MEHHHSDYRGWKLGVAPNGPWCLGHGVRATRPHQGIMAKAPTEVAALDDLHHQVDAIEDAAG